MRVRIVALTLLLTPSSQALAQSPLPYCSYSVSLTLTTSSPTLTGPSDIPLEALNFNSEGALSPYPTATIAAINLKADTSSGCKDPGWCVSSATPWIHAKAEKPSPGGIDEYLRYGAGCSGLGIIGSYVPKPGYISVSVDANPQGFRSGEVKITSSATGGVIRVIQVNQTGPGGCAYSPSLFSRSGGTLFQAGNDGGTISVISTPGCPWKLTSDTSWITLSNTYTKLESGAVTFDVLPNPDPGSRTGVVTLVGHEKAVPITIAQAGASGAAGASASTPTPSPSQSPPESPVPSPSPAPSFSPTPSQTPTAISSPTPLPVRSPGFEAILVLGTLVAALFLQRRP